MRNRGDWGPFFEERLRRAVSPPTPGTRQPLTPALRRQVESYYDNRCVITDGRPGRDLHHINEDCSDTIFANLVPIGATYNAGIERSNATCGLIDSLHPRHLRKISLDSFERGNYRRSYGCDRIAAHLFLGYQNSWTEAAQALVFALTDLRPEGRPDLLLDTAACLAALISLHKDEDQAYYWGAEFISQLSLVMYDHLDVGAALDLADVASRLAKITIVPEHPAPYQQRLARMRKRFVLAHSPSFRSPVDSRTADLLSILKEAVETARYEPQARTSGQFTQATVLRTLGKITASIDIATEALSKASGADNWAVTALHVELALGFAEKNDKKRADENFDAAIDLPKRCRINFIPVPVQGGLIDPISILGPKVYAPMPSLPVRGGNPFSASILTSIVDALPFVR